jgi:hypothetical protein
MSSSHENAVLGSLPYISHNNDTDLYEKYIGSITVIVFVGLFF